MPSTVLAIHVGQESLLVTMTNIYTLNHVFHKTGPYHPRISVSELHILPLHALYRINETSFYERLIYLTLRFLADKLQTTTPCTRGRLMRALR